MGKLRIKVSGCMRSITGAQNFCAIGTDRARRSGATLLARPAGEPLWDAIAGALRERPPGARRRVDGRAVAQADGLSRLPDPRINLWITLQGCHERR